MEDDEYAGAEWHLGIRRLKPEFPGSRLIYDPIEVLDPEFEQELHERMSEGWGAWSFLPRDARLFVYAVRDGYIVVYEQQRDDWLLNGY